MGRMYGCAHYAFKISNYSFLKILFSSPSILKIIPRVMPGISNLTCIFFCYNCYIIKDQYTLIEQSLNFFTVSPHQ